MGVPQTVGAFTGWAGFWGPNAIITSNGTPLASYTPTITIWTSSGPPPTGSGTPTFYTDWTRTTTASAPITDALGNLSFWTDPGIYVMTYTLPGAAATSFVITVEPFYPDAAWIVPASADTGTVTASSGEARFANAASASVTETLPAPGTSTAHAGSRFKVTKVDTSGNPVYVQATGGSAILQPALGGGWTSTAEVAIFGQGTSMEFICDGTNWSMTGTSVRRVGVVEMFAGVTTPPPGSFFCLGQAISRSIYVDLFQTIGTTYGDGDGSSTFNIPNFQSVSPIGAGTGSGLTARSSGAFYGAETHQIAAGELPSHGHLLYVDPGSGGSVYYQLLYTIPGTGTTFLTGSTQGTGYLNFSNSSSASIKNSAAATGSTPTLSPVLGINFIIWAQ